MIAIEFLRGSRCTPGRPPVRPNESPRAGNRVVLGARVRGNVDLRHHREGRHRGAQPVCGLGDKRELFGRVVEFYLREYHGWMGAALREEPTLRAGIDRLLTEAVFAYTRTGHPPGCLVISSATNCASVEIREMLRAVRIPACLNSKASLPRRWRRGNFVLTRTRGGAGAFHCLRHARHGSTRPRWGDAHKSLQEVAGTRRHHMALGARPAPAPRTERDRRRTDYLSGDRT